MQTSEHLLHSTWTSEGQADPLTYLHIVLRIRRITARNCKWRRLTQGSVRNIILELDWLNMLVDRVENKGYITQADQVWFVHRCTVVFTNCDFFFFIAQQRLEGQGITIPLIHTTLGRIHLDDWSARWRKLYKLYNTHKIQTLKPPSGYEPAIPARVVADAPLRRRDQWGRRHWRGCKNE